VRRRSTLRLTAEDVAIGYALACQTVIEGDVTASIPPQEKIERRLTTDRTVAEVTVPIRYDLYRAQTIHRVHLSLTSPSLDDQTDDWSRLKTALRQQAGFTSLQVALPILTKIGAVLREGGWLVTAILDVQDEEMSLRERLIDLLPGHVDDSAPLWALRSTSARPPSPCGWWTWLR
jgi:uncharacterized 2Fe-2S/4Fe-4S cluster protein (DUF4445 family)